MTKGEVPTMAGQEQAAEKGAEQKVAQEQSAPVAEEKGAEKAQARQMTAEAVAAAAAEEAVSAEQAPVQMASLETPASAPVKAVEADDDKNEKKGEKNAEAEADAPVDLAMLPEVEMLDAIAAADGARATPGAEGEASASLLSEDGGFLIPLLAVAAVGLGIAVAVGGGDDEDLPPAPPPPPPANQAPVISSGATGTVEENAATTTVVYDAAATDADGDDIEFSISGGDSALFTIDEATGEVRFIASPDFETGGDNTYTFTVTATDEDGATDTQEVTVTVTDMDEGPVFSSEAEFDVDENVGAGALAFTAVAADADGGDVTYSLEGEDADMFEIDEETGEVRFIASPDFETQESYTVTVVATDDEGETTSQDVTVTVNDIEAEAPVFSSDADVEIAENSPVSTVVYTAEATDPDGGDVTYSISGDDAAFFDFDEETGELTFIASPDFETRDSYEVTITATDEDGNTTEQDVTVSVTDVDDDVIEIDLSEANEDAGVSDATETTLDAADGDFMFVGTTEGNAESFVRIENFGEGDMITFNEDAEVSFSTVAGDPTSLEIIVNTDGNINQIILDGVLGDDAGLIFNEATAEGPGGLGFDFFDYADAAPAAAADSTFA